MSKLPSQQQQRQMTTEATSSNSSRSKAEAAAADVGAATTAAAMLFDDFGEHLGLRNLPNSKLWRRYARFVALVESVRDAYSEPCAIS